MRRLNDCCAGRALQVSEASLCPICSTRGKPVDLLTVKALLTENALAHLNIVAHCFCLNPSCDVVYFEPDGAVYRTSDLRVPVSQKKPFGSRMICYCFGESEATIREEIEATGRSDAVKRVRAHVAAGRCACEVRNPRGTCCLGDVTMAVQRVQQLIRAADTTVR